MDKSFEINSKVLPIKLWILDNFAKAIMEAAKASENSESLIEAKTTGPFPSF